MNWYWIKNNHKRNLGLSNHKLKQRQFGWMLTLICVVFCVYSFVVKDVGSVFWISLGGATLALLLSFFMSFILKPVLYIWFWVGAVMSEISSFIILGVIYYLLFAPVTLLFRIKRQVPVNGWQNPKETKSAYEDLF